MDPNVFFKQIAALMLWLLIWPITLALLFLAFQYLIAPLRRRERAGLLLDLIETALKEARRPENTLAAVSDSGDPALSWRFHALAAELGRGSRLAEAVQKVPGFVPAPVSAMLRAGELVGDIGKVLPACRQMLKDGISQTRGAINYLMVLAFVGTPAALVVLTILQVKVFPQFMEVTAGMEVGQPAGLVFLREYSFFVFALQLLLMLTVWLMAFLFIGGPRTPHWLGKEF